MKEEHIKYIKSGEEHRFYSSYAWQKTRARVVARDNYECQMCKSEGRVTVKDLIVHHIVYLKDDPSRGVDAENLTTVCREHHEMIHENDHMARNPVKKYKNDEKW